MTMAQRNFLAAELFGEEPQWRLARVELANWGTFGGLTTLDVNERGLLVTGPSGSGKSTLLDAIATVLTPPRVRHYNVAARSDGGLRDDRSIVSYVRGAWRRESDEAGEVTSSYLRPNGAVWSGILLTYRSVAVEPPQEPGPPSISKDGGAEPVQLLVLFNLKAGSNDRQGLTTLYGILRGDYALADFQPYALNGIDKRRFKQDFAGAQAYDSHPPFSARFCQLLGIHSSKTLELLHKTQGAKNFGSLDDLFRNFMLDEPESFDYAKRAVEQFQELSAAHAGVVDQRDQMKALEPLVAIDEKVRSLRSKERENQLYQELLTPATDHLIANLMESTIKSLERKQDKQEQTVALARTEAIQAKVMLEQAEALVSQEGGLALGEAERDARRLASEVEGAKRNRAILKGELAALEISEFPASLNEWRRLVRRLEDDAQKAQRQEDAHREENRRIQGRVGELNDRLATVESELEHLRRHPSNVPKIFDDNRAAIAKALGVETSDLPFVGELLDVREAFGAWRGAIERLFGRNSLTLLVPLRLAPAVAAFVDRTNLHTRFEFVSVAPDLEAVPPCRDQRLVAARLEVRNVPRYPEYARWLRADLARRWDYVCVDSPQGLRSHAKALTINGQIKRKSRYIKDDRFSINDRTRWLLGSDNAEKLEGYERDRAALLEKLKAAEREAETVERSQRSTQALVLASRTLGERSWDAYDLQGREREYAAAKERVQRLKQGNEELRAATALRDEALRAKREADERLADARVSLETTRRDLQQGRQDLSRIQKNLEGAPEIPEVAMDDIRRWFQRANRGYERSIQTIYQTSQQVAKGLSDEGKRLTDSKSRQCAAGSRIMQSYKQRWPAPAADFGVEFEEVESYLSIYRQVLATGLPGHESQFLKLLQDFSQDSITRLASTIRSAPGEIETKLEPVNDSLGRSYYSPGTHLSIQMRINRSRLAQQFLSDLKEIASGSLATSSMNESEPRYDRAAAIIKKLGSEEPEDRRWRRQCLDTRQHVRFIAREINESGEVVQVYESDAGLSGGQKQKLVIFCLAAALRFQLADEERFLPSYATVILDEAFDKADFHFAKSALEIFEAFGFHLLLATPLRHLPTIEDHVGAMTLVECEDSQRSTLHTVVIEKAEVDEPVSESPISESASASQPAPSPPAGALASALVEA